MEVQNTEDKEFKRSHLQRIDSYLDNGLLNINNRSQKTADCFLEKITVKLELFTQKKIFKEQK